MDQILTDFVSQTKADPALAHDLLEATGWDLEAALSAFQGLHDTHAVLPEDQLDFAFDPGECTLSIVQRTDLAHYVRLAIALASTGTFGWF